MLNEAGDIEITVALPCYNAVHIGWLALESLCNQVDVNFNWELVVCEELHEDSIDTDGHNNISVKRINFYKFVRYPFVKTSATLDQTRLPSYIVERIKKMSNG